MISLTACKKEELASLPWIELPAQEVYISHNYTSRHYGVVVGSRNMYFTYGSSPLGEVAGTGASPTSRFQYKIADLVSKWPQIDDKRVQKAIAKQVARIELVKKVGN
jgi:hypothetical protein